MPNVSLSSDLSPLAFSFKMMHRIPLPQLHFDKGPSFKATFCWCLQVNTPFEFGQCNLVDIFWQPSFSWDKNHNTMSQQVSIKIFYNLHRRPLGTSVFHVYCFIFDFLIHFQFGHFGNIHDLAFFYSTQSISWQASLNFLFPND